MSSSLQDALKALSVISALLLVGTFLRAKIPLFRKLLLPASVIGGFLGLLLGPRIWGGHAPLPFPDTWLNLWGALPGLLIVPIFSAAPLGMFMEKKAQGEKAIARKALPKVLMTLGLFSVGASVQCTIGFGLNLLISHVAPDTGLYRIFGYELSQGFAGGHGMASGLGGILEGFGIPYWQTAQGVALTFATIGLIGGMLFGIVFVNRASRKGQTKILKKPAEIPAETASGCVRDIEKQGTLGRETTVPSSIETITVHLAILLLGSGLAYGLSALLKRWAPGVFGVIPVWFLALLLMYLINFILIKLNLHWLIDPRVKRKITGTLSDFAIASALASVPIKAVLNYLVPIILLSAAGFVATYFVSMPLYRFCFKDDYAFERGIMSWGANTGVMITGMMLLKICDPEYKSPAISHFSMGFALMSLLSLFITPLNFRMVATGSTLANFLFGLATVLFYGLFAVVGYLMLYKPFRRRPTQET